MSTESLPPEYHISKDPIFASRWVVSYKGDPYLFIEKVGASGQERIKTFKTQKSAYQAIKDHVAMIEMLEGMGKQ